MSTSEDIETFVASLAGTIESELIRTGDISADTRLFYQTMGYVPNIEPLEPPLDSLEKLKSAGSVYEYIGRIEQSFGLPITGDLEALVRNYKEEHYTHDCLSLHRPQFCWLRAIQHSDIEVVQSLLDSGYASKKDVDLGLLEAVKVQSLALVKLLLVHVKLSDTEIENERFFNELFETAESGSLDVYNYLLETILERYLPSGYRIAEYIAQRTNIKLLDRLRYIFNPRTASGVLSHVYKSAVFHNNIDVLTHLSYNVDWNTLDVNLGYAMDLKRTDAAILILDKMQMTHGLETYYPDILARVIKVSVDAELLENLLQRGDPYDHIDDINSAFEKKIIRGKHTSEDLSNYLRLLIAYISPKVLKEVFDRNMVGGSEIVRFLGEARPELLVSTLRQYLQYYGRWAIDWGDINQLADVMGVPDDFSSLLVWAAKIGSLPLARVLIKEGVDPHYDNDAALTVAQQHNHACIVKYLSSL